MKLKKTTLFIVIIVLGLNVFSQNTQDFNLKDDYKNSVLFAPFSIIGPYNPAIEIGYQKKINDKFSVLIQAGYITKRNLLDYTLKLMLGYDGNTYSGFKTRLEFKYYPYIGNREKLYVSTEL